VRVGKVHMPDAPCGDDVVDQRAREVVREVGRVRVGLLGVVQVGHVRLAGEGPGGVVIEPEEED